MDFLKNIFKGRNNGSADTKSHTDYQDETPEINDIPDIDSNLFKEDGEPEKIQPAYKGKSILGEFLEKDFYSMGYNHGYDYPASNIRDSALAKIKSDLLLILEKEIDELNREIINLEIKAININGIYENAAALAEKNIAGKRELILKLNEEKEQCNNGKGLVLSALNNYRSGFEKGFYNYTQESKFTGTTGIF